MTQINTLLELRNKIKARKPKFLMQDSWKKKELPKKWRKPKGMHSKIRMRKKGHPKMVSPGYGSPRAIKGFSKEGLKIKHVSSLNDLKKIKNEAIIISRTGIKKKIELVKEAIKMGLKIINLAEPEKYLAAIEKKREKEKTEREKKLTKKEIVKKEMEKKPEEKPLEEALSEEEKKKIEKREKEKILIKRE